MMNQEARPSIPEYKRHVIFCTGDKCAPETSDSVYDYLKARLRELGVDQKTIRRSQTRCFGICEGGPLMVVYPEGVWYDRLTKEKVETIIQKHLLLGEVIQEWCFHSNSR